MDRDSARRAGNKMFGYVEMNNDGEAIVDWILSVYESGKSDGLIDAVRMMETECYKWKDKHSKTIRKRTLKIADRVRWIARNSPLTTA